VEKLPLHQSAVQTSRMKLQLSHVPVPVTIKCVMFGLYGKVYTCKVSRIHRTRRSAYVGALVEVTARRLMENAPSCTTGTMLTPYRLNLAGLPQMLTHATGCVMKMEFASPMSQAQRRNG
jgi:hypothetical protein